MLRGKTTVLGKAVGNVGGVKMGPVLEEFFFPCSEI